MQKLSIENFVEHETILIDSREQIPFFVGGLYIGESYCKPHTKRTCLKTGDYSIEGYSDIIAIERKSRADFWQSITHERKRFESEIIRLSEFKHKCVIIEGDFDSCISAKKYGRKISPLAISATVASWQVRYNIPFYFLRGRKEAEIFALQTLYFVFKTETQHENT